MRKAYLYIMDKFIPLTISLTEFLELATDEPLRLFKLIRSIVEDEVGQIYNVQVYGRFFDSESMDIVIEYLVKCKIGKVSAKIIYSNNPSQALMRYYGKERQKHD